MDASIARSGPVYAIRMTQGTARCLGFRGKGVVSEKVEAMTSGLALASRLEGGVFQSWCMDPKVVEKDVAWVKDFGGLGQAHDARSAEGKNERRGREWGWLEV